MRRNIFNWKQEKAGLLEAKVKSFCDRRHVLDLLQHFIVFAEKDEELNKYILAQHQTEAVERVANRCLDTERTRGLVWHTQGSGKTFTMIKAAERLFKAPASEKPTILLIVDRNELEDQMCKNLAALGLNNVEHANRISTLVKLLQNDYRGIIVTTIHKFRDMPAKVNERSNVFVLIDEAHRTTGGDLGNFLMAGLPNATYIGFTGTPIDKTAYGKGTFKTFGCEDDMGYLHKYSIAESITDQTTLPLFYNLAPNEMQANAELMEEEFWALAEAEGVADVAELNKILERAVNLKNFLKGDERVDTIAQYVADHFEKNIEPLGYKAFLIAVDRPACAKYKQALDKYLPPDYSEVVFTGNHNDPADLKQYHIDETKEKQIRKDFARFGTHPKILIVTEKLLTGFDAPILYAMYLDKPMRDHTLLQAIARVNRPYQNETEGMVKPHGFVLDFVGIFDKLEKALAFDSDEVEAVIKDIGLLKGLFKNKMEQKAPEYIALISDGFSDRDVNAFIEHFRDKERREEFFKEYKEIEMLYEIISPDAFLRPFINNYVTLSAIYDIVRKAYQQGVYVDRALQKKTNELVQKHVGTSYIRPIFETVTIDAKTMEQIAEKSGGEGTKIINLVKSMEQEAEDSSDDLLLLDLAERARAIQERYEDRQISTQETLKALVVEQQRTEQQKSEQAALGFDDRTYFVYASLRDAKIGNAEAISKKIAAAFAAYPNWQTSQAERRDLRQEITFAVVAAVEDFDQVASIVDALFSRLDKR